MTTPQIDTIRRIGEVSRTYETNAVEFKPLTEEAARAEAHYRHLKALFITPMLANGSPVSKSEYAADADDAVAAACLAYKLAGAVADAARARLTQLRSQMDYGRSVLTSEREADRIAGSGDRT